MSLAKIKLIKRIVEALLLHMTAQTNLKVIMLRGEKTAIQKAHTVLFHFHRILQNASYLIMAKKKKPSWWLPGRSRMGSGDRKDKIGHKDVTGHEA